MNKAEIMTLQLGKVPNDKIRLAIMAGKISGILHAAEIAICQAEEFGKNADWIEMLKVMEGTLNMEAKQHQTESIDNKLKSHSKYR